LTHTHRRIEVYFRKEGILMICINLNRRSPDGFTLVELLVVIGIITVLIGLLLPVLSKVRDAALTTQCASNLRQQGVAVNQYLNDSHGFLPPYKQAGNYVSPVTPYLHLSSPSAPYIFQYLPALYQNASADTWICPADALLLSTGLGEVGPQRGPYPEVQQPRTDIFYSYALNDNEPLSRALLYPGTNLEFNPGLGMKIRQSAAFMFLHETNEDGAQTYDASTNWFRFSHQRNTAMNVLFMDGHVDTRTAAEILPSSAHPMTADMRAFWFGQPDVSSQMLF
jgi:prepilin-type N-terminal cleavage/methylation domain-containing protein/prepilin-type processing-associated H-X9-DG protein